MAPILARGQDQDVQNGEWLSLNVYCDPGLVLVTFYLCPFPQPTGLPDLYFIFPSARAANCSDLRDFHTAHLPHILGHGPRSPGELLIVRLVPFCFLRFLFV